jgi:ribonuclease HI
MSTLIVFTDGGARGNPGPAAIGAVIKTETGQLLNAISRKIGITTNNVAEYSAVISALEWIRDNNPTSKLSNNYNNEEKGLIRFFLDSNLVVNQLNGLFKVKDGNLRELMTKVRILESEIGMPTYYKHIPREKNFEADKLVNQALDNNR